MTSTEESCHHIKDPSFLFYKFIIEEKEVPKAAKTLSIISMTKLQFPHKEQYESNLRVIQFSDGDKWNRNEIQKISYIKWEALASLQYLPGIYWNIYIYKIVMEKIQHQAAALTLTVCVWQNTSQGFLMVFTVSLLHSLCLISFSSSIRLRRAVDWALGQSPTWTLEKGSWPSSWAVSHLALSLKAATSSLCFGKVNAMKANAQEASDRPC